MDRKVVIIPTYNEKENISAIIEKVLSLDGEYHVLVIDDGSPDGTEAIVKGLMEQYRGKVVYVDFWASWCRPCVGQFPAARELHKRMAGQDVQFLCISLDVDESSWLKAVRQNADLLTGSYRTVGRAPVFLKEIRLTTIPRYLIFDRNGKLVDPDAPRPIDKEVDDALRRWL